MLTTKAFIINLLFAIALIGVFSLVVIDKLYSAGINFNVAREYFAKLQNMWLPPTMLLACLLAGFIDSTRELENDFNSDQGMSWRSGVLQMIVVANLYQLYNIDASVIFPVIVVVFCFTQLCALVFGQFRTRKYH